MALYDGTNAPLIKVYLDVGNRNAGLFTLGWSGLAPTGTDVLGQYTPFTTLTQFPANDVKNIAIRRGRTREDQAVQAGSLTLTMDNTLGTYDPEYAYSEYIIQAFGSGVVTVYSTSAAHSFKVGQVVSITGMTTSSFNLNFQTITATTSTSFTVANGTPTGLLTGQSGVATTGYFTSTLASLLTAGTGVQVTATITYGGGPCEIPIYTGFIEQVDKDMSLQPVATITCVDGLAQMSRLSSTINTNGLGEATAIGRILDSAGWNQNFYYSSSLFQVSSVPVGDVLTMVDPIVRTQANAMFFCNASGDAIWKGFAAFDTGSWAGATKKFTMTDARTSTDVVEYDQIAVTGGEKYMRNQVTITNTNQSGIQKNFTRFNQLSVAKYGPTPAQLTTYYVTDDAPTVAQHLADQFADPAYRVETIGFEGLGLSSTLWYNIITADLGSAVQVNRTPIYSNGYEFVYQCWIQELNHDINPTSWRISLTLSPGK